MENGKQLAKRVLAVLLDGKWIANTNFKEQILETDWQQAIQKVGNLNTIAALTFHINYYTAGINNVFKGGELAIRDKYSFDLPPISSAQDWNKLRNEFIENALFFVNHVEKMSNAQLESTFVDEKYGNYRRNIEGVIEHSYYHLGQVSLIRKMVSSKS